MWLPEKQLEWPIPRWWHPAIHDTPEMKSPTLRTTFPLVLWAWIHDRAYPLVSEEEMWEGGGRKEIVLRTKSPARTTEWRGRCSQVTGRYTALKCHKVALNPNSNKWDKYNSYIKEMFSWQPLMWDPHIIPNLSSGVHFKCSNAPSCFCYSHYRL